MKVFIVCILLLCTELIFAQPPAIPTLATPGNGSVNMGNAPVFNWNTSAGSTYRFQISLSSEFSILKLDSSNIPTGQFYFPLNILQQGNTYYWRVNATNSSGTSSFSSPFHFSTVGALPLAPVLTLPLNSSGGHSLTPTLTWNSQLNIVSYHVQVSNQADFTTIIDSASVTTPLRIIPAGKLLSSTIYFWRVKATNFVGTGSYSGVFSFSTLITQISNLGGEIPKEYKLFSNYPNPFNPITTIKFNIPKQSNSSIKIYDINGKFIKELINKNLNAGTYEVQWNAENTASGIYFYILTAEDNEGNIFRKENKMILLK